ncbi:ATP-binding cassette domain-containing protein [Gluconobacter morbifer]|uniref:ABC transporter ATP-binding protein n=1 Tax=Gluconobacter morbifer G707 TaxID=1088869 RepID=G6XGW9_9PROT|nr:ABC transporter ATP-binding protein [Gluconobacter morbifer]EHH69427.1 ABC transporter ATP-binding protein [Gluconobacter morbifer G707]
MADERDMLSNALNPVLELLDAVPRFDESGLVSAKYNLHLDAGECALIECRDMTQASLFADMCLGLVPLSDGHIRCMGLDWSDLNERRSWALRGRCGRIVIGGGWIDLYGTHINILWPQLHHTRTPMDRLVTQAGHLATRFGLPGLPVVPPGRLSAADRQRAACARAFLGEPSLLLLEHPMEGASDIMMEAFLSTLTDARDRGCAVVWFAPDESGWGDYASDATIRLRLYDDGLFSMRGS